MTRSLTGVTQVYAENQCNYRCVFGHPVHSRLLENTLGRKVEQVWFKPLL